MKKLVKVISQGHTTPEESLPPRSDRELILFFLFSLTNIFFFTLCQMLQLWGWERHDHHPEGSYSVAEDIIFFFLSFCLFRAAPVAYGGSQARSLIGATDTATRDPSCVFDLHHSSQQCQILNPLSKARDPTRNLMVPSQIRFHSTTMGTPR